MVSYRQVSCVANLTQPTLFTFSLYRCSGLRDDLNFLLEEELSSINLCSLHCEMRNCEQLLGSLGLFAYRIGSLDKLNEVLSNYGPENCRGFPRVTIKERKGQQTEIMRQNIQVAFFSGMPFVCIWYNLLCHICLSFTLGQLLFFYQHSQCYLLGIS